MTNVIREELSLALRKKRKVTLAVPGGTTPKLLFNALSLEKIEWKKISYIMLCVKPKDAVNTLDEIRKYCDKTHVIVSFVAGLQTKTISKIVLSLGFAVLYFSELMPNHEFGILATIILLVALVGSIFLLPALLILFNPKLKLANKK